jgi:hypothetical protein
MTIKKLVKKHSYINGSMSELTMSILSSFINYDTFDVWYEKQNHYLTFCLRTRSPCRNISSCDPTSELVAPSRRNRFTSACSFFTSSSSVSFCISWYNYIPIIYQVLRLLPKPSFCINYPSLLAESLVYVGSNVSIYCRFCVAQWVVL